MLFFLPFFGQKMDGAVLEVSLLDITEIAPWLRIMYFAVVIGMLIWGILTLALQNCHEVFWIRNQGKLSLLLNAVGVLLFVVSLQPYAAILLFVYLAIKVLLLLKWQ
jgi:hypothetical protein